MKLYSNSAVIGLGFGDEGKGVVTNALAQQQQGPNVNPVVVRYSGGQQAGHTVTLPDGTRHVFSNFGSGSLVGAPTYWSEYCTIDPVGIVNERAVLHEKGVHPKLHIDARCPVTTPLDILANIGCRDNIAHGTCGVGVGKTWQREADHYSLLAGDLESAVVTKIKLDQIRGYYGAHSYDFGEFLAHVHEMLAYVTINFDGLHGSNLIFEGSQGLLLDQDIGFFPNVTRSSTGTKNIFPLWTQANGFELNLYLVTRAYQTRHGNGPMTNEKMPLNVIDNPDETNQHHEHQGPFRKSVLDLSLLCYGVLRDEGIKHIQNKTLVVTCCDQVDGVFQYTVDGRLRTCDTAEKFGGIIADHLGIDNVITVDRPDWVFE